MTLSTDEIEKLMRLVGLTKDQELNCEQCLALLAEFAEQRLDGRTVREGLQAVAQHLDICPECREEYEALQRALQEMDG